MSRPLFRYIKGYRRRYSVTSDGRVFSHNISDYLVPGVKFGYHTVNLFYGSKYRTVRVNRLVAEAFLSNPDNLPQVNHKDCNRKNNSVGNLEWCTASENTRHRKVMQRLQKQYKKDAQAISELTERGLTVTEIAKQLELPPSDVLKIKHGLKTYESLAISAKGL